MFDLLFLLSFYRNQGQLLHRGKTETFLYRIDYIHHLDCVQHLLQSKMDLGSTNLAVSKVYNYLINSIFKEVKSIKLLFLVLSNRMPNCFQQVGHIKLLLVLRKHFKPTIGIQTVITKKR